jgi:hypothetical protein
LFGCCCSFYVLVLSLHDHHLSLSLFREKGADPPVV